MDTKLSPPPADSQPSLKTRMRKAISEKCASPLGSAIFATSSVAGAAMISVCSGIILGQLKSFLKASLAQGFWTTLIASLLSLIAIIVLWFRERGIADMTEDKEASLRHQQALMEGRLVSMPPKAFIYEYVMALRKAGELRMQSKHEARLDQLSPEQVRERIRSLLSTVVVLTRLWDGVSTVKDNVLYKANVMNVVIPEQLCDDPTVDDRFSTNSPSQIAERNTGVEATEVTPVTRETLASGEADSEELPGDKKGFSISDHDRPLFQPTLAGTHPYTFNTNDQRPANDDEGEESWDTWVLGSPFFLHSQSSDVLWERCTGAVAIVDTQLSVTSSGKKSDAPPYDDKLQPIVLPYTLLKEYKIGHHHPNLPGAPWAAATGQPGYIEDLGGTIKNWITKQKEDNTQVTKRYLEGLEGYYKSLDGVSSLISIPVLINDKLNAVLNIQKSNESLLYNHERADMFIHLMSPICYHLGRMLLLMYTVDAKSVEPEGDIDEQKRDSENGTQG